MKIGTKRLLELVKEINLVKGLSKRELNNPEGSAFELRVGEVYRIKEGRAFLGVEDRATPPIELIAKYNPLKKQTITLKPGDYVLIKTIEKVNLPENITASFGPRTTLQRCGVQLITTNVSPGYSGELTFGLKNHNKTKEFELELGARITQIQFEYTSENISTYRGQWQGGRVSTEGQIEEQV